MRDELYFTPSIPTGFQPSSTNHDGHEEFVAALDSVHEVVF
jgi:hypothetical protein